jgi:cytoskeleton protein RodZ
MSAGRQLREARIGCGLSIAEVANQTKISSRHLEALEAEQYERLPGGVFVRGYARAVAPIVGLNPDEIAAALRSDVEPPSERPLHSALLDFVPGPPRLHLADEAPERNRSRSQTLVTLIAISAVVLVIVWLGLQRSIRSTADPAAVGSMPTQAAPAAVGTTGR